jgi:hypothetical protein
MTFDFFSSGMPGRCYAPAALDAREGAAALYRTG